MLQSWNENLCFDDVLLVPQYSEIPSRHEINVMITDEDNNPIFIGDRALQLPIFAAPMDTVVDEISAKKFVANGVCPILHRYCTIDEQVETYNRVVETPGAPVGAAVGATGDFEDRSRALYDAGCRFFCVDVAHGHHILVKNAIKKLRDLFGNEIYIMAGNIATLSGFEDVSSWGADFIRCGVGGGSVCSTRLVTGHGIPTLQTVFDCAPSQFTSFIVADGGLKNSGDIVKALAAGADFVMLGSLFAGCEDTPGEKMINDKGQKIKVFRGMASKDAQKDWRGKVSVAEGVTKLRPIEGNISEKVSELVGGIRSGLSYSGVKDIVDLCSHAEFVKVSANSIYENKPHSPGADCGA